MFAADIAAGGRGVPNGADDVGSPGGRRAGGGTDDDLFEPSRLNLGGPVKLCVVGNAGNIGVVGGCGGIGFVVGCGGSGFPGGCGGVGLL